MSQPDITMLIGGIIAIVLGGIDVMRTNGQSLTAWGVVVLGVVFAILALT